MQNLTGVPSVFDNLNMGAGPDMLDPEERAKRKKKIMAAGQTSDFQNAVGSMFGERLNSAGTPRA